MNLRNLTCAHVRRVGKDLTVTFAAPTQDASTGPVRKLLMETRNLGPVIAMTDTGIMKLQNILRLTDFINTLGEPRNIINKCHLKYK